MEWNCCRTPVAQQLLTSTIPARLAYTSTDGTPRLVSLWFQSDGTDLVMGTFQGAPKLKARKTGDRVALTIDTDAPPNHVLSILGTVHVAPHNGVVAEYARAAARYLGTEQGNGYIQSLPTDVPMARIAVRPDQVVLLDFETRVSERAVVARFDPIRTGQDRRRPSSADTVGGSAPAD